MNIIFIQAFKSSARIILQNIKNNVTQDEKKGIDLKKDIINDEEKKKSNCCMKQNRIESKVKMHRFGIIRGLYIL